MAAFWELVSRTFLKPDIKQHYFIATLQNKTSLMFPDRCLREVVSLYVCIFSSSVSGSTQGEVAFPSCWSQSRAVIQRRGLPASSWAKKKLIFLLFFFSTFWVKAAVCLEESLFCVWFLSSFQCNSFVRNRPFRPAVFLEIHAWSCSVAPAEACVGQGE